MTAFRVMLLREFRSIYRNPAAFGLLLIMPFALMALISKAFEPLFEGRQSFDVPLVDLDATEGSDALITRLDALEGIDIVQEDWDRSDFAPADADEILDDSDYFTLVVIPDGFADSLEIGEEVSVSLYSDPAQKAYSGLVEDQIQAELRVEDLLRVFESTLAEETGDDDAARIVEEDVAPRAEEPALAVERLVTEKRKATPGHFEQTVPGFALMFTFWLALFIAASIHAEKQQSHTWQRLLVAPVPRATIMGSRVAAYVMVGMVQMTLLFVLGWAIFGVSLGDHPYALLLVFFAMTLVTTGFGILMTSLIRDLIALTSLMNLIVILAAAAGGTLVPLFLLPDWLRTVSPAVPHYWAMDASQNIMLLGDGVVDVLPAVAALLGFAAVFFALSLWRFRFVD